MGRFEHKEEGGYKITRDLINQILKTFDMLVNGLQDVLQALRETLAKVSQDICKPRRHRGTRQESSIAQAAPIKENIKWREKYRPP